MNFHFFEILKGDRQPNSSGYQFNDANYVAQFNTGIASKLLLKVQIVSVSNFINSSHIIFQGYSRIINNINTVIFTTNLLFSSDPNWTIQTMRLENSNLVIKISDNSIITSDWIISLESIYI